MPYQVRELVVTKPSRAENDFVDAIGQIPNVSYKYPLFSQRGGSIGQIPYVLGGQRTIAPFARLNSRAASCHLVLRLINAHISRPQIL
jgi:hypothetical protein